jgi:MFS family permease
LNGSAALKKNPSRRGAKSRRSGDANKPWLATAVLLTGNFVTILDLFIVNVALESIRKDLGATPAEIQLVIAGYSVAYGVLLMNGARLGDLYGRRRVFLAGMGLFTVASALCGLATTPTMLVAARVLQGIGAAVLMPQVYASLRLMFKGDERRRAFGIMGAVQGVAASISQLTGGALIASDLGGYGWRLVFLINLPIGIAAIMAGRVLMTETRAPIPARLDVRGAMTGAFGIVLLLLPLMEGREHGWPWWSLAMPLLSIPVFVDFVRYEKRLLARGGVPIIEISLFRNSSFVLGVVAISLFYSAISSFFLSLTILLQAGLALSPIAAGAVFTPSAVAFFAGSLTGPRLARSLGHKALLIGTAVFAMGLGLSVAAGLWAPDNLSLLTVSLIMNGAGQGIVIPLALNTILSGVSEGQAGMGSGTVNTMQTIGTSTGVAIVGILFFSLANPEVTVVPEIRIRLYGHAFAVATTYNVFAALVSFTLFARLERNTLLKQA